MRPSLSSLASFLVFAVIAALITLSAVAQEFPNPLLLTTAEDPNGLATADWNGDGNADLAYVTTGSIPVLHLLIGDGKGHFTAGSEVTLPEGTCTFSAAVCRIFTADFGHTGHPGVLLTGNFAAGWGLLYLPGNGDGSFGAAVLTILPSPFNAEGFGTYIGFMLGVGDFNGDGNLDVAAPDYYDGQIRIYLGDGKGAFSAGEIIQNVGQPFAIYAADLNRDGKTDLLVLNVYGTLGLGNGAAVYLGDGAGNFTHAQTYPAANVTFIPRWVADINGDGYPDVLGADGSGNVLAMTGNADASFNAPQTVASGFESESNQAVVYAADITGSGIPSLLVNSNEGFDTAVATASLKYGPVQRRTSGLFGVQVAAADFNSDGAQDVALGVAGGIELFYGSKSGLFPDSSITATPAGSSFLFAGDFNGDGIADVASPGADGIMRTYFGSKSGVFQAPVQSGSAISISFDSIGNAVGDFDGDGHQDILMNGQVLYGSGDGTFTTVKTTTVSNGLLADLNKDGKSDLLSMSSLLSGAGSYNYYYALNALLGTAQRSFTQITTSMGIYPPGSGITTPALLAVGDLNGDGIPDAAVFDPNVNKLEAWLGKGDGSFKAGPQISPGSGAPSPQGVGGQSTSTGLGFIADLDDDGKADLAFLATESAADSNLPAVTVLVVEYGDGRGGFSATQVIPLSHGYTSVVPMHLAAGALPGFALDNGTVLAVVRNLGGRQFSNEELYSSGSSIGIVAADFNGDGLSDLLVTRSNQLSSPSPEFLGFTTLLDQAPASGNGNALSNGALTVNPSTVNYNEPFTLTAAVQPAVAGAPKPTGMVSFSTANLPLGSAQLISGSAVLQVPGATTQQLLSGILQINAAYSGDGNYAASDLTTNLVVLNPQYSTTTRLALASEGNTVASIQAGSFLTMTATVSAPVAVPRGIIAFFDGSTVLGQEEIASGGAVFSTNLLAPGSHSLSARYMGFTPTGSMLGTSAFLPSSSAAAALTVTSIPTNTSLNASSPTVTSGAVLTLDAQVSSGSGTPIGSVTFLDGTTALGTYSLDASGKVSFSTASLNTGAHSFSAQYALNVPWAASSSASVAVTAQVAAAGLAPTTTLIAAVTPGSDSSLLTTVQVFGAPLSQGTVTLLVDGQAAATVPFTSGGVISIPLHIEAAAVHRLVASYSGSIAAAPSASPQLETTPYLPGQDFTLQAAQGLVSAPFNGSSSAVTLRIGSVSGWSGTVSLSCTAGLPSGYSCAFSPTTLTGTGAVTLTLVRHSGLPALGLLLMPGLWLLKSRNRRRAWLAVVLLASLTMLSSCGSIPDAHSTKTWVVTVQAASGSTLHSTQIGFITGGAR
jgi:hypothetical protein